MNVLGLCLVYASLVNAGFLTPNPKKHEWKDDVTLKAGHAGVVIELEKDDGSTKVSVSPKDSHDGEKGFVEHAKDKLSEKMEEIKEASSSLLPKGLKKGEEEEVVQTFRPGEVVCDVYGKCKDKIESYTGRMKEAVETKAHEAASKVYEAEEEAKEVVKEAIGKTAHRVSEKARDAKENVKDAASEAKEKVAEKVGEMKEGAKEKAKEMEELVESVSDRAKHRANEAKNEVKKGILRPARGVYAYIASPVAGVLHLLGFSVAYGMCVWVTFASNYVLAGALPRHLFAMVQSKIYPVYFKAMACSVGIALLAHTAGQGMLRGDLGLITSLAMILVNLLYLEPRATRVMLERIKKEKEEGSGKEGHSTEPVTGTAAGTGAGSEETTGAAAATKPRNMTSSGTLLRRLNSYSSMLNVATLMSLTWHLVHLGKHLHAEC